MLKFLILFLIPFMALGQLKVDDSDYSLKKKDYKNYIINPFAEKNATDGITASSAGIINNVGNVLDGKKSFGVDMTASGQTIKFKMRNLDPRFQNSTVEFGFIYNGTLSTSADYQYYIEDSGGNKIGQTYDLTSTGGSNPKYVTGWFAPGGTLSNPYYLVFKGNVSNPDGFDLDMLYAGDVTQLAQAPATGEYGLFKTSGSWSSTANTNIKIPFTEATTTAYSFSSNCPVVLSSGKYIVEIGFDFLGNGETLQAGYAINGGTVILNAITFPIYNNGAGDSNHYIEKYIVNLSQGDIVCAYSRSNATRTTYKGWMSFTQLEKTRPVISGMQTDYGRTPYTPTFTGWGTVSNISCFHERKAAFLVIDCKFTAGTATATEARVSLPNGLSSASTIPTLEYAGDMVRAGVLAGRDLVLREPSVGYLTFGISVSSISGLAKQNGNAFASSIAYSFSARVPIQGWEETQRAATYAGSVTSASGSSLKHEAARITCSSTASAVVSTSTSGWATPSNTANAGQCTVALTGFRSEPWCNCTMIGPTGSASNTCFIFAISSSSLSIARIASGAGANGDVELMCSGIL